MARVDGSKAPTLVQPSDSTEKSGGWWPWLRRGLTLAFFVVVAGLLVRFGSAVEWDGVWRSARAQAPATLLLAAGLAVMSHALVASYDLIGRHVTGHGLSVPRVWLVAWVSYTFNLNLGALVGGAGFRWRLYSRLGLDTGVIAQVYALSVVTNWLAYLVLLGATLAWTPIQLPADWQLSRQGLTALGIFLPLLSLAYVLACACATRRRWQWRGHTLALPSGRVAAVQLLLSAINWSLIAGILYILLGQQIGYSQVLAVTLLAAVAGAVTHVPAGLGVVEAVFVSLLGAQMPQSEILAALLTYRAIYYLGPLMIGSVAYGITEFLLRQPDGRPVGAPR